MPFTSIRILRRTLVGITCLATGPASFFSDENMMANVQLGLRNRRRIQRPVNKAQMRDSSGVLVAYLSSLCSVAVYGWDLG